MEYGRYEILACTVKYFREKIDPETNKVEMKRNKETGEMEVVMTASFVRYIYFIMPSGFLWRFTSNKRDRWSDSRDQSTEMGVVKPKSFTDKTLRIELARLTSADCADRIMEEMAGTKLKREEYVDLVGASIIEMPMSDGTTKSMMVGGLPARIEDMIKGVKAKLALDKSVNR